MRAGGYLIALAGAGVLAAGCGTVHAGQPGTPDVLTAAVSRTATQTARIAVTIALQTQGMSESFTATGEFDFAHSRGMITMAAPVGMTALFLPPMAYVKMSSLGSALPHGKTWLAIDTRSAGDASGMLGPFGSTDNPADLLASLTAIAGSERVLGSASVRGVPVTEYQVNIDPAKMAAKMAAKVPASEQASVRQFAQSMGKGAIPVDVWVDGQDMVRQVRLSLHMPAGAGAPAGMADFRLTETTDFYDFGVRVRVSAPPAAEVTSLSGLSASGVAAGSGYATAVASALPVASLTAGAPTGSASPAPPAGSASPAP